MQSIRNNSPDGTMGIERLWQLRQLQYPRTEQFNKRNGLSENNTVPCVQ